MSQKLTILLTYHIIYVIVYIPFRYFLAKIPTDYQTWCYIRCPIYSSILQWRHNGHDSVSNHQPHHCLFNRLFRRRSKKTSKLRIAGLCEGNSPEAGEFPAQMASNAENVSIWWRHHGQHQIQGAIPTMQNIFKHILIFKKLFIYKIELPVLIVMEYCLTKWIYISWARVLDKHIVWIGSEYI